MKIKSSFTFYQVVEDLLDQTAKNVDKNKQNMCNRFNTSYPEQV